LLLVEPSSLRPRYLALLQPPLPSPLVPYTTLFRSSTRTEPRLLRLKRPVRIESGRGASALARTTGPVPDLSGLDSFAADEPALQDRKSTRLNSSHVSISYAVFCLKQKKNRAGHVAP